MTKSVSKPKQPSLPPPDPHGMFQLANAFLGFTQVVANQYPDELTRPDCFDFVGCANLAFSLELHLKCLIAIESNSSERGHDLHDLFNLLKPATQGKARQFYADIHSNNPEFRQEAEWLRRHGVNPDDVFSFDVALAKSAKAFEIFRYAYEWIASDFTVGALLFAIRRIILESNPTWDPKVRNARLASR